MRDQIKSSAGRTQRGVTARWWSGYPEERYWFESSDRTDVGADLRAPLHDATGGETWRYCLFREARLGDIVYHYDSNRQAVIASSIVAGPAEPRRIEWVARGSYAKRRSAVLEEVDGYRLPLVSTNWITSPLTLEQLRLAKDVLLAVEASALSKGSRPLYFPFELSKRPVRPLQGYAFKLPAAFVAAFPQIARLDSPKESTRTNWSELELAVCVEAYANLLERQRLGDHPNYADVMRDLAMRLGRRRGAVDRCMQSISLYCERHGLPRVARFPPGQSLTSGVESRIGAILEPKIPIADSLELEQLTARVRASTKLDEPLGSDQPAQSEVRSSRQFRRRADVRAWVLQNANDLCEGCAEPAPFVASDGFPFLEVHHMRPLAQGGPDTTCNAAALCPNCHRRLHLGLDREEYRLSIIAARSRLRDHPLRPIS